MVRRLCTCLQVRPEPGPAVASIEDGHGVPIEAPQHGGQGRGEERGLAAGGGDEARQR